MAEKYDVTLNDETLDSLEQMKNDYISEKEKQIIEFNRYGQPSPPLQPQASGGAIRPNGVI